MKDTTVKDLPKDVRCPDCSKVTPFSVWVYAHWDIPLNFTCECGNKITVIRGMPYEPDLFV